MFADLFRRQSLTMLYLKDIIRSGKCLYVGSCGGSCRLSARRAGCQPEHGAQAVSPAVKPRNAADVAADHRAGVVVHDSGGCAALGDSGRGARLLEHIKETTHLAVADGAPDGQIAIDTLRREGFWRNLIARHWDQAHGARRITQRPWKADAETHEIIETLVTGSHSLTMLFENSPALRGYLKSNIDKYCGGDEISTAGLSSGIRKHRYDSTQMPMIRSVLRTRATTATAVQIARAFKGDHSALCCDYYLLYVSGTTGMRRLLLFSMMTDAGDEVVVVGNLRFARTAEATRRPEPRSCRTATGGWGGSSGEMYVHYCANVFLQCL